MDSPLPFSVSLAAGARRDATLMEGETPMISDPLRMVRGPVLALVVLFGGIVSGCASYIGTTATSFMHKAQDSPDPNIRHQAYAKLASPNCYDSEEQKAEAVSLLTQKLKKGQEPTASRAVICRTLGELGLPDARPALLKAIEDPEHLVRESACRALGNVGQPEDATTLARIMAADPFRECRIAAIEGLATLKSPDPRVLVMLVDGMEHEDPAIRVASLEALRTISGQDLGVEVSIWRKYANTVMETPQENAPATATAATPEAAPEAAVLPR